MKKKGHKYFVSYSYMTKNSGFGFGNGIYTLDDEITDMKIVKELTGYITNELKENNGYDASVVIINFQKL